MTKSRKTATGKVALLLIEPNPHHQELLSEIILEYPYKQRLECHRVNTIEEATASLANRSFNLIISADFMSLGDHETLWPETLRALAPRIPIIILTSLNDPRATQRHFKAGITEVLVKSQESLRILPQLLVQYLHHQVSQRPLDTRVSVPPVAMQHNKVRKILHRLNRLSDLSTSFGGLPQPLKSIRNDLANLTKMVKELL